jgi:acetyltransferase-like isoleucine patch superfamily enzyme
MKKSNWFIRVRKLAFRLTPRRFRSFYLCDNPWLAHYEIGEWSIGNPKVLDWGTGSKLTIGRFCSIAPGVTLFVDGEHHTDWVSTYAFTHLNKTKETQAACVTSQGDLIIGNDVWIGDAATVMSGVKVGNGAAIGARSLVVKDVPAYAIVSGVPARFLKLRFTPQQIAALERIAWWDWPIDKVKQAMPILMSNSVDEFIAKYS